MTPHDFYVVISCLILKTFVLNTPNQGISAKYVQIFLEEYIYRLNRRFGKLQFQIGYWDWQFIIGLSNLNLSFMQKTLLNVGDGICSKMYTRRFFGLAARCLFS
jgi:hypothetical protein